MRYVVPAVLVGAVVALLAGGAFVASRTTGDETSRDEGAADEPAAAPPESQHATAVSTAVATTSARGSASSRSQPGGASRTRRGAERTGGAPSADEPSRTTTSPTAPPVPRRTPAAANELIDKLATRLLARADDDVSRTVAELAALIEETGPGTSPENRVRLVELTRSLEPAELRTRVGRALALVGQDPEIARRLVGLMRENAADEATFAALCEALGGVGGPHSVADVAVWLDPGRAAAAAQVAGALAKIGGADAERALLGFLRRDMDPQLRHSAEGVWLRVRDKEAFVRVADTLASASGDEAASLVRILRETKDPAYSSAVLALLDRSDDETITDESLKTLAAFGDEASIARLFRVLSQGDRAAFYAEQALRGITSPEVVSRAVAKWPTLGPDGRQALLHAAIRIDPLPRDVAAVAERALSDANEPVRVLAATALGRRGGGEGAVAALAAFLRTEQSADAQTAALHGLRRIGTPEAAEAALGFVARDPEGPGKSFVEEFEAMRKQKTGAVAR